MVKVVLDKAGRALYFSRAAIPWHRDAFAAVAASALPAGYAPLRHIGLYAYSNAFLQAYPSLEPAPLEAVEALEQLRVLWHGYPIAVHVTDTAPAAGVDTPEDLARVRLHYAVISVCCNAACADLSLTFPTVQRAPLRHIKQKNGNCCPDWR